MASSYPTSLDTFTNPTSSDNLDSPDHATQHSDVNDAVEALETKLGTGTSPASGAASGAALVADGAGGTAWAIGTYLDRDEVWLPATSFSPAAGGPLLSNVQRWPAYLMDPDTAEGVCAYVPTWRLEGWTTFNIGVWWTSGSAGTGDVRFRVDYEFAGDGDTISAAGTTGTAQNFTTGGANVVNVEASVESGIAVVAGDALAIRVIRDAGNAGDTVAGDCGVLAVKLTKAS